VVIVFNGFNDWNGTQGLAAPQGCGVEVLVLSGFDDGRSGKTNGEDDGGNRVGTEAGGKWYRNHRISPSCVSICVHYGMVGIVAVLARLPTVGNPVRGYPWDV
jgi:hypothetical protein